MTQLALAEIQGLVLTAYPQAEVAQYLFLRIVDPAACRTQLQKLVPSITSFPQRHADRCINIAFTASGLARLGLSDRELGTFSRAFTEGMTVPDRLRLLGDSEQQVEKWFWGSPARGVDVAILVFHVRGEGLAVAVQELLRDWVTTGACALVAQVQSAPRAPGHGAPAGEHFGFADGISQPIIRELVESKSSRSVSFRQSGGDYFEHNCVAAGEFLFGYSNEYARLPAPPLTMPRARSRLAPVASSPFVDFGTNGSYMVVRQLEQDVAGFWQAIDKATQTGGRSDPAARLRLASQMVGRWPNGAPLAKHPDGQPQDAVSPSAFLYFEHDPHGIRCPLGAHIRRTNPRDALGTDTATATRLVNRHRILRRGRPYGPWIKDPLQDDGQQRGLMFVCFNTNIERQFEFIQNTWANNPKFAGLYSESDPLFGSLDDATQGGMFTVQAEPVRRRYQGLARFVKVVGGGYFFLPSLAALQHLTLRD